MFIVFEGIDGLGKTTLIDKISSQHPGSFIKTKEPGSSQIEVNQQIRSIVLNDTRISAFSRELLFYADANEHRRFIEQKLADKESVLSDRGYWSHLAYLYGCLKTKQLDWAEYSICRKAIEQVCIKPTAIVYFKGSIELMKQRSSEREKDAIESMGPEFYTWVLTMYDDLLGNASIPVLTLDATSTIDENLKLCEAFIHEVSGGVHFGDEQSVATDHSKNSQS